MQKFERSGPSRTYKAKQVGMEQHHVIEVVGPLKEVRLEQTHQVRALAALPLFDSQTPHGSSLSVTAVPGNPVLSSDLCRYCTHVVQGQTDVQTSTHTLKQQQQNLC